MAKSPKPAEGTAAKPASKPGAPRSPRKAPSRTGQPTKAEMLEMLAAMQKKTLVTERALAAAEGERDAALEDGAVLRARLEVLRDDQRSTEIDLGLAEDRVRHTAGQVADLRRELVALTALLAEEQAARKAVEKTLAERDRALESAPAAPPPPTPSPPSAPPGADEAVLEAVVKAEARVTKSFQAKIKSLETASARQGEQLDQRTRELVEVSRMLAENEARHPLDATAANWLRTALLTFLKKPSGRKMRSWELRHYAARLVETDVIDTAWYLGINTDVADEKIDPAIHYLKYGIYEGRLPRDLNTGEPLPIDGGA